MNAELRQALAAALGPRFIDADGGAVLVPSGERELIAALSLLRSGGARLGEGVTLSRANFDAVREIHDRSATGEFGAGLTLEAIERVASGHGLSLGPLSPGARALTLAEFLEGPYAGLRPVRGGRLEPLCLALCAVLPRGQLLETKPAPRSAAGPDLHAFVLGGRGRAALVVSAVLRLAPAPETQGAAAHAFGSARALISAVRLLLGDGALPEQLLVARRGPEHVLQATFRGPAQAVSRDAQTLATRAGREGAHPAEAPEEPELPKVEREVTWEAVARALDAGRALKLFRLAQEAAVAQGEVEGRRLDSPEAAPKGSWDELVAQADPERVLGGAP